MTPYISKLEAATRELLKARPRELTYPVIIQLAAEKGGDLSVPWLNAFMAQNNTGFSIVKVELLYVILSGKDLSL